MPRSERLIVDRCYQSDNKNINPDLGFYHVMDKRMDFRYNEFLISQEMIKLAENFLTMWSVDDMRYW